MMHKGLNQLLCAAVVNERFRESLLHNPAQAIAGGYMGQSFGLTPEEHDVVVGIRARELEDFAAHIHSWMSGNGAGSMGRTGRAHNSQYGYVRMPDLDPLAEMARAALPL
jgi:hypothetical protein